jgi:four helix bundle protein
MAFAFEKLLVYQKAITFADQICTLTRNLPRGYFFLADQMNRAALSIAINIAETNPTIATSFSIVAYGSSFLEHSHTSPFS